MKIIFISHFDWFNLILDISSHVKGVWVKSIIRVFWDLLGVSATFHNINSKSFVVQLIIVCRDFIKLLRLAFHENKCHETTNDWWYWWWKWKHRMKMNEIMKSEKTLKKINVRVSSSSAVASKSFTSHSSGDKHERKRKSGWKI